MKKGLTEAQVLIWLKRKDNSYEKFDEHYQEGFEGFHW